MLGALALVLMAFGFFGTNTCSASLSKSGWISGGADVLGEDEHTGRGCQLLVCCAVQCSQHNLIVLLSRVLIAICEVSSDFLKEAASLAVAKPSYYSRAPAVHRPAFSFVRMHSGYIANRRYTPYIIRSVPPFLALPLVGWHNRRVYSAYEHQGESRWPLYLAQHPRQRTY
jgi:hypothetical protein